MESKRLLLRKFFNNDLTDKEKRMLNAILSALKVTQEQLFAFIFMFDLDKTENDDDYSMPELDYLSDRENKTEYGTI